MHRSNHAAFVDLSRLFLQATQVDTVEELATIEAQARVYLRQLQGEQ